MRQQEGGGKGGLGRKEGGKEGRKEGGGNEGTRERSDHA